MKDMKKEVTRTILNISNLRKGRRAPHHSGLAKGALSCLCMDLFLMVANKLLFVDTNIKDSKFVL